MARQSVNTEDRDDGAESGKLFTLKQVAEYPLKLLTEPADYPDGVRKPARIADKLIHKQGDDYLNLKEHQQKPYWRIFQAF
jgi:hypothetical protein